MTYFLKSFALFIPFCVGIYLILLCMTGSIVPVKFTPNLAYSTEKISGNTFTRLQEAQSLENTELLVLGSSHAYRGFDTRNFDTLGIKTFNIGTSAQTPVQTLLILQKYLDKIKPKKVIFEVNPDIFGNDGVGSSLDLIVNADLDRNLVENCIKTRNIKVINTLLFATYRKYITKNPKKEEKKQSEDDTYIQGGYVEHRLSFFRKQKSVPDKTPMDAQQVDAFYKIIDLLKQRNIEYTLVQAPVTQAMYKGYTKGAAFDSIMSKKGNYLDFNKITHLDDSLHFYDKHHLNRTGVAIFNKSVIDTLLALHFLTKK